MSKRYCYIIRSKEIPIAHVFTGFNEARTEGLLFAKKQGLIAGEWVAMSDELTTLNIRKSEAPMEIWIERHRLK